MTFLYEKKHISDKMHALSDEMQKNDTPRALYSFTNEPISIRLPSGSAM